MVKKIDKFAITNKKLKKKLSKKFLKLKAKSSKTLSMIKKLVKTSQKNIFLTDIVILFDVTS